MYSRSAMISKVGIIMTRRSHTVHAHSDIIMYTYIIIDTLIITNLLS